MFDMPTVTFAREFAFPTRAFYDQTERFWNHNPYQVHEDDKEYTFLMVVPGVKAQDMKIKVEENVLHLRGGQKIKGGTA
jgi:HSP20 family molecular chaperone IbpA